MSRIVEKVITELQDILGTEIPNITYYEYNPRHENHARPFIGVQLLKVAPSSIIRTIGESTEEFDLEIIYGSPEKDSARAESDIEFVVKKICDRFKPYSLFLTDSTIMIVRCSSNIPPANISRQRDYCSISLTVVAIP